MRQETTELLQLFNDTADLGFLDLLERPALKFPLRTIREGAPNNVYSPLPVLKATHPTLKILLDALEHATAKFDFLRTSQADWQRFYLFPRGIDDETMNAQMTGEEENTPNSDYVINRSKTHATNWLHCLLEHINPDPDNPYADLRAPRRRVTYILGKVGCGKSSFIKYMMNSHIAQFCKWKVICTRIECRKLTPPSPQLVAKLTNRGAYSDVLLDTLTRNLVRDIIRTLSLAAGTGTLPDFLDTKQQEFADFFARELINIRLRGGSEEFPESAISNNDKIKESIDYHMRRLVEYAHRPSRDELEALNRTVCEIVVLYAHRRLGYAFLPILDGFDYISAADRLLDTQNCNWLYAASRAINDWDNVRALARLNNNIPMHFIVVLRENTLAAFMRRHQTAPVMADTVMRTVVAPSAERLLHSTIKRACERLGCGPETRKRAQSLVSRVSNSVLRRMELPPGLSFGDVFNNNTRFLMRYIQNVLLMFLHETIESLPARRKKNVSSDDAFNALLEYKFDEFLERHDYRLIEVMLLTFHIAFHNWLKIRDEVFRELRRAGEPQRREKLVREAFYENDYYAGFIDNVFNYHNKEGSGVAGLFSFYEKLWVIELTRGSPLSEDEIRERLLGQFRYDAPGLEWTLAFMVKNGQLGMTVENNSVLYFAERQGEYVNDVLAKKMAYIEHAFHQSLYPVQIAAEGIDCVKYLNKVNWPYAAIVNCFIHVQFLRYLERRYMTITGSQERICRSDDVIHSICKSVERMCEKDSAQTGDRKRDEWLSVRTHHTISKIRGRWEKITLLELAASKTA